ncbi:undecaprenyl-phosphate alpha-N-acetylglucosaminyl 1-phosphate transferase [Saccharobesus litoralis]|uniref:Undecaprenyl-phosphate alpha-N-acetylglucosaminyl 1-phosphate transferase n=1 Tax=Saccharobesus litoralis TaxID=2172099 RepID=A0A2S0VRN4_9ALTE|nr:UDP-N-acetylglucosamine--undecaprenyl-phosphate N-acetylglucosaminephosphotransferase [Saccharobesus litoralis]AWB66760.1 undecaprenyl-phosphate alpha-N-acetylglucosaminyl 1-phosphate transferase [Saccharobesus litoralis]
MEFLTALLTTLIIIPFLKPIADKVGLVDLPNARKHHNGAVPLVGGIAIFLGTMTACMMAFPNDNLIQLFLISAGLIVLLGVMDDYHDLSVKLRIIAQILIACILVYGEQAYLANLGNLFGFGDVYLGTIGTLFTIIAVIAAINAFNMTDGIDGLAGSLALTTFGSSAILFYLGNNSEHVTLPLIIAFSVIPFLLFNLSLFPGNIRKIFMGDAGSMFIGLSVIWILVIGTQGENAAFRPVTALWIIAIPLMDMAAIMYRRIRKGQSPFKPDRDHLHHIFMRAGFTARQSLMIICTASVMLSLVGIISEIYQWPEPLMLVLFIAMFLAYNHAIVHVWKLVKRIRVLRRASKLKKIRLA